MRRIAVIGNGGGGKTRLARAQVVSLVGRDTKLVHLRSPREMAQWLGAITRTPAGVAG